MRTLFMLLALHLSACVDATPTSRSAESTEQHAEATPPSPELPAEWPTLPTGTAWPLSAEGSSIGFVGRKITGQHVGGFNGLTGSVIVVDGAVVGATVNVDMGTTWSDNAKLTKHLLSGDFFDATTHPSARFATADIQAGSAGTVTTHTIQGVLDMRGTLGRVRVPSTIEVEGETARVRASFHINRQQWGIKFPGKPDNLIQDDVEIQVDLKFEQPAG
jgi:polyisoprenoid-binding protein YceI